MNIKNLVCSAVVALIVLACAPMALDGGRASKPCPGNSCDVEVRVKMIGGVPTVVVDYDELKVAKGNSYPTITWKLKDSSDYRFKNTSIAPHTGAASGTKRPTTQADWDSQITFLNNSAVNYVVENANSKASSLYYDITVYKKSDDTPVKLDPAIINDGP